MSKALSGLGYAGWSIDEKKARRAIQKWPEKKRDRQCVLGVFVQCARKGGVFGISLRTKA
jgi:hypothetical protein